MVGLSQPEGSAHHPPQNLVPQLGLEPRAVQVLNLLCLPIPPQGQVGQGEPNPITTAPQRGCCFLSLYINSRLTP